MRRFAWPMGYTVGSPAADGRPKPDIVLPGVNIVAARSQGTAMGTPVDAYYTSASGTSIATPHAAGLRAGVRHDPLYERGRLPAQIRYRCI